MIENILHPLQEDENIEELVFYLRKAQQGQGNTAFWIGAGISKLAGYPLWQELVDQLIQTYLTLNLTDYERHEKKQYIRKFKKDRKFEEILEIIKSDDKKFFEKSIKKIFKDVEQNSNKDIGIFNIISKFIRHRVKIITTNLDMELENILRENLGINEEQISVVPEDGGGLEDKYIFYLHGRIDKPDSWILTEKDYAQVYDNSTKVCNKFLERFFRQLEALVIMGYSLSEKEIYRKFLSPGINLKIFWIQLLDTPEKRETFEKQIFYFHTLKLSIKPIPYKESEKLTNLLEEIYKRAYELNVEEVFEKDE